MKTSKVPNSSKVVTPLSKPKGIGSSSIRTKWRRPAQKAHLALLLPELVMKYVEDLPVEEVLSTGLVCHAWRDGAMEIFWSTKPVNFEMLAHILAPRDLGKAGIWQWYKRHDIAMLVSPSKWQAFMRTTRKITWIKLQTTGPYPSLRAIQQLAEKFGGPVLPRVSNVDFTARMDYPDPRQLPELHNLFGPTVKHVYLNVDCGLDGPDAVIRRLMKVSGNSIESIHFAAGHTPTSRTPRFRYLAHLRALHLENIQVPILALAAIPHLSHLTLSGSSSLVTSWADHTNTNRSMFKSLETFFISVRQEVDIYLILGAMEMPRLRSFSARFLPQSMYQGLHHLAERSPLLEEIKLESSNRSPKAWTFQCFSSFRLLRRLSFTVDRGITDPIVEALARNAPSMEELHIQQNPMHLEITHRGLVAIARHCTSLRKLSVSVDISHATAVDDLEKGVGIGGSASIEHLTIELLDFTHGRAVLAGKLLGRWFPHTGRLVINNLGTGEDNKEAVIEAFYNDCTCRICQRTNTWY